ncbi:MAG: dienelactone hydrolase family protein [Limnochordia bacterium]|nr:dienelactone hydrolase family protein [Limnochordia bacterium]
MGLTSHIFEKTVTKHLNLPYLLYLPQGFEEREATRWPLVVFLHGAGERGEDLLLVPRHGLIRDVQEGREFPFIILAPQCPVDWTWDRSLDALDYLLEEIIAAYPIDTERVYLTGLSMGGYGTWHWACHQPQAFAALVPICGGAMPLMGFPARVEAIRHVPTWVFHGDDDQVVPRQESDKLVAVLQGLQAPIRYTKYAGVGHNAWSRAYAETELFPWLLEQRNMEFRLRGRSVCE